jgi:hypothetical protein
MPKMVDVMLSSEDVSRLAVFFAERGQSLDNGTAWLIEEGARHFCNDQSAWEQLNAAGVPDGDPRKLELQRREAVAHLISMRARTVSTETEMEMLRAQVSALGAEYKELRASLMRLQDEQRSLKAALDTSPRQAEAAPTHSLWSRFRHWMGRNP